MRARKAVGQILPSFEDMTSKKKWRKERPRLLNASYASPEGVDVANGLVCVSFPWTRGEAVKPFDSVVALGWLSTCNVVVGTAGGP